MGLLLVLELYQWGGGTRSGAGFLFLMALLLLLLVGGVVLLLRGVRDLIQDRREAKAAAALDEAAEVERKKAA
jgi:hypothetical protein